jgi:hypothetical protein
MKYLTILGVFAYSCIFSIIITSIYTLLLLVDLVRSIISSPFYTLLTYVLTLRDYYYNRIMPANIYNSLRGATLLTSIDITTSIRYFRITP